MLRRTLADDSCVTRTLPLFALCAAAAVADPLTFATATGIVGREERSRIEAGGAVVSVVSARKPDFAAFGLAQTKAPPPRLIAWSRTIEHLYRGTYVPVIGRFSTQPRLDDLSSLRLDPDDLNDLRECRPGDCGVKLSAVEIGRIRGAASAAGEYWQEATLGAFREVLLTRAQSYLASGLAAAPPYFDQEQPISPQREYAQVAARIGLEPMYGSQALPYFDAYPHGDARGVESFLYWSKETLGGGKPIVSITHVAIFSSTTEPVPYAMTAARQVYASHYLDASLSFTIIVDGEVAPQYLVYMRRLRTDAFEGAFGWLIRGIVERRIRAEGPALMNALRRKLEGSDPPISDSES